MKPHYDMEAAIIRGDCMTRTKTRRFCEKASGHQDDHDAPLQNKILAEEQRAARAYLPRASTSLQGQHSAGDA